MELSCNCRRRPVKGSLIVSCGGESFANKRDLIISIYLACMLSTWNVNVPANANARFSPTYAIVILCTTTNMFADADNVVRILICNSTGVSRGIGSGDFCLLQLW
jgi:hypothetical protein